MAEPSWLSGLYGPIAAPAPTPPASLTVLQQQGIPSPTTPPPRDLGENMRTPSVF